MDLESIVRRCFYDLDYRALAQSLTSCWACCWTPQQFASYVGLDWWPRLWWMEQRQWPWGLLRVLWTNCGLKVEFQYVTAEALDALPDQACKTDRLRFMSWEYDVWRCLRCNVCNWTTKWWRSHLSEVLETLPLFQGWKPAPILDDYDASFASVYLHSWESMNSTPRGL